MKHFELGKHQRKVSTTSAHAQFWFNMGLNWCYAFNQEEGVKCFEKALEYDSNCVMAHWGAAYAFGPFYNYLWRDHSPKEAQTVLDYAHQHLGRARTGLEARTGRENPLEDLLVEALAMRFQSSNVASGEEYDRWDDDYANAMRNVYQQYPNDHDVMALFIEAMMTRTAWKMWDVQTGLPPKNADTYEALEIIQRSITINDTEKRLQHLGVLHWHIHAMEMSPQPEDAMRTADILGTLCPDGGHLHHMPGHIYVLCGLYEKAKNCSEKAISADQKYLEYAGAHNFYTTARCHDLHLMMYSCMFLGQYTPAINAANMMRDTLNKDVLLVPHRPQLASTLEGYYSTHIHVMVRFGRWEEIIAEALPDDPALYRVSIPMHHYAKTIAFAALKNFAAAERERETYFKAVEQIPQGHKFFNNSALHILGVAEMMMEGELCYHQQKYTEAFAYLRKAVQRDDALLYNEPWAWMHPPRHALGALLIEQGHYAEAEQVYRTDLGLNDVLYRCAQHPENVWSLHGLVECLRHRGEKVEIKTFMQKLQNAQNKLDKPIKSSCMCRGMSA